MSATSAFRSATMGDHTGRRCRPTPDSTSASSSACPRTTSGRTCARMVAALEEVAGRRDAARRRARHRRQLARRHGRIADELAAVPPVAARAAPSRQERARPRVPGRVPLGAGERLRVRPRDGLRLLPRSCGRPPPRRHRRRGRRPRARLPLRRGRRHGALGPRPPRDLRPAAASTPACCSACACATSPAASSASTAPCSRPSTSTTCAAEGYAFQVEMTYRASLLGFRVVEVPIVFTDRVAGGSKMSRRIVAEAAWRVPLLRMRALLGRIPSRRRPDPGIIAARSATVARHRGGSGRRGGDRPARGLPDRAVRRPARASSGSRRATARSRTRPRRASSSTSTTPDNVDELRGRGRRQGRHREPASALPDGFALEGLALQDGEHRVDAPGQGHGPLRRAADGRLAHPRRHDEAASSVVTSPAKKRWQKKPMVRGRSEPGIRIEIALPGRRRRRARRARTASSRSRCRSTPARHQLHITATDDAGNRLRAPAPAALRRRGAGDRGPRRQGLVDRAPRR